MPDRPIAAIADVHLHTHKAFASPLTAGVNDRATVIADLLRAAVGAAESRDAVALIVCGDLFDTDRPSPQVMALAAEALGDTDLPVLILTGNHDLHSALPGDHALGPLAACSNIRVFDAPRVVQLAGYDVLMVPFQSAEAKVYIPEAVKALAPERRDGAHAVLAIHAGISDEHTPVFLRGSHEAIDALALLALMRDTAIAHAWAGNWHDRHIWSAMRRGERCTIQQCGALAPTGFDNPGGAGRYGTVAFYSAGSIPTHVELPGPRFFRVSSGAELDAALADRSASRRYISAKAPTPEARAALTAVLDGHRSAGRVQGFRVDLDATRTDAGMALAATGARSATTLSGAIDAYVGALALSTTVTKEALTRTLRDYLGITEAGA